MNKQVIMLHCYTLLFKYSSAFRSSHRRCPVKKVKFTGKHLYQNLFLFKVAGWGLQVEACNFINKEFLAQVFSCKFQNTFFAEQFWATISGFYLHYKKIYCKLQALLIFLPGNLRLELEWNYLNFFDCRVKQFSRDRVISAN